MIKEIIFVKKINEKRMDEQQIVVLHKIEINEEISLTKQVLEYCWDQLPFGFKPQYIG